MGRSDFENIIAAKRRIENHINETPILKSCTLNSWLGHEVFFKCENFQKTGAFKVRGALNTLSWLLENGKRPQRVIANSSGNHAQAVAYAGQKFGIPVTIFMPEYSSKVKIKATRNYKADIVLSKNRIITDELVAKAATQKNTCWIPPFNHKEVIYGQGTAALEALNQLSGIDAVFAPCGGGGLLSGTFVAAKGVNPDIEVVGAEPLNANDAAESIRKKSIQKLTTIPNTIADGAMTMSVGDLTFKLLKKLDDFYEISEDKICYWTQWLTHLLKCHVEPTSALAMGAAEKWLKKQSLKKKVLVIISGGNIDQDTVNNIWSRDYLENQSGFEQSLG